LTSVGRPGRIDDLESKVLFRLDRHGRSICWAIML
jgi:hypothetical protein